MTHWLMVMVVIGEGKKKAGISMVVIVGVMVMGKAEEGGGRDDDGGDGDREGKLEAGMVVMAVVIGAGPVAQWLKLYARGSLVYVCIHS